MNGSTALSKMKMTRSKIIFIDRKRRSEKERL